MVMLNEHNKIYGSLGIQESLKTITKIEKGTGQVVLTEGIKAPFEKFELSGDSAQTTTKGINLIPFKVGEKIKSSNKGNSAVFEKDGVNVTVNNINPIKESDLYFFGNDNMSVEGGYSDELPAGEYTFLSNSKLCNFYVVVWRDDTIKILVEGSSEQITHFTILDGDKVRLFLRPKGTANSKGTEKAQVMLCKHTEVNLTYEPYTGGKPSPSQEYPQEIVSAGDDGSVGTKVTGKNLFDISKLKIEHTEEKIVIKQDSTYAIKLVENFKENTRYTVSFESHKNDGGSNYVLFEFVYTDGSKSEWYVNAISKKGFQSQANKTIDYLQIRNPWKAYAEITKIQVEKGIERTEYEAYKEPQTAQLQLDEPLRGIGQYKDIVTKKGVLRNVLEGNISDNLQNIIYGQPGEKYIFSSFKKADLRYDRNRCMSNVGLTSNQSETRVMYVPTPYQSDFLIKVADDDTVETVREKTKNMIVAYVTKTPIFEPFPPETQLALDSLHANDGTTVISVDSGEVETGIEVHYKSYGNNVRGVQ